jgi:DNA-directed RNA polymerase specialized sigma24 family protein
MPNGLFVVTYFLEHTWDRRLRTAAKWLCVSAVARFDRRAERRPVVSGNEGSITRWYEGLKTGDREAVGPLFGRYFERMTRLARSTLRAGAHNRAVADEEDAALSAFDSFRAAAERGRFPHVGDREDLWRLLAVITVRKARAQVRLQHRLKRGGGQVVRETDLAAGGSGDDDVLDGIVAPEPDPGFTALAAEELERLLDLLRDDTLRQVAVWRMEGYTCDEIAERMGCARRTVARQLDLIRKLWSTNDALNNR